MVLPSFPSFGWSCFSLFSWVALLDLLLLLGGDLSSYFCVTLPSFSSFCVVLPFLFSFSFSSFPFPCFLFLFLFSAANLHFDYQCKKCPISARGCFIKCNPLLLPSSPASLPLLLPAPTQPIPILRPRGRYFSVVRTHFGGLGVFEYVRTNWPVRCLFFFVCVCVFPCQKYVLKFFQKFKKNKKFKKYGSQTSRRAQFLVFKFLVFSFPRN